MALLVASTAAAPASAARRVSCAAQSFVTAARPLGPNQAVMLGPAALGGGFRHGRALEQRQLRDLDGVGIKSSVFFEPGHRLVLRLARRSRDAARLSFGNRAGDALRFGPCSDPGSRVGGEPMLFYPGGLILAEPRPVCLHFRVRIDDRAPRRLRIPMGRRSCARA